MSNDPQKTRASVAEHLASFDARLAGAAADVDLLSDIQSRLSSLLANDGGSEAEVRAVLKERFEAGDLRPETYQLVGSLLDRYVTEKAPTIAATVVIDPASRPGGTGDVDFLLGPEDGDAFGATTIIPEDAVRVKRNETRAQVGSLLRDRFLLQEQVSGESMGVVYKAVDRRLAEAGQEQALVAIKVLSPQLAENALALRALQQEASKGRCLVHPNIVRFIDLDRDEDLYFIVMEWLEGRSLADILDSGDAGSIDSAAAFRIIRQIGSALSYAHRCGIVHADVKPGNIMIMPNGDAKLFDFGVARVRQKQAEGDFDPGILGAMTPAYSSMQVLGGEEPVASDDVFSLACLMYRLIAGYRVFGPRNAAEASQEGMKPQRPQGLADDQWKALKKALSYSRVTRYKSVDEFLEALTLEMEANKPVEQTMTFEAPERFVEDDGGSPGKWAAIIVVLLGLAGLGAKELGYLDPLLARYLPTDAILEVEGPAEMAVDQVVDVNPEPQFEIAEQTQTLPAEEVLAEQEAGVEEEAPAEAAEESAPTVAEVAVEDAAVEDATVEDGVAVVEEPVADEPVVNRELLVDFSKLPPPHAFIRFAPGGPAGEPARITLREDAEPVMLDFIRSGNLNESLTLRLEEIGFTGNRSPWGSGQYALSNSGLLQFPAEQERARITLRMASDPRREADQTSTLRLREVDSAESELAIINVTLEDDDQRTFEQQLPVNTIAFASSRESISEADPAVQLDIVRFNPDGTSQDVRYTIENVSATEGEDFFAPANKVITIGPGQRSARLLIPLAQDSAYEGDEAFVVELAIENEATSVDVFRRVVIMIRDDDPPNR
jgi:hypothetical protein